MADKDSTFQAVVVQLDANSYWYDANGDGRQVATELIKVPNGNDRNKIISARLTELTPHAKLHCAVNFKLQIKTPTQYFDNPKKKAFELRLKQDIASLSSMANRPEIYSHLLDDLKIMVEELKYTRFRFPTKDESIPRGFLGTYDPLTSSMLITEKVPTSLLVHEMDHALSAHQRIKDWSIPFRAMGCDDQIHDIPQECGVPLPTPENSQYTFSLDYSSTSSPLKFTYNDVAIYVPEFRSLESGKPSCTTEESKKSSLANEVRGYLTMCRYLLFRMGYKGEELKLLEQKDDEVESADEQLRQRLNTHLKGSNLNPNWVYNMLTHYFGRGDTNHGNLDDFVKSYYEGQNAPGFVDVPQCSN